MSRFAPVWLPEDRRLNGKTSQTFLRHANGCMRSGWLYARFKGEAQTVEMVRGSALHTVLERSTALAIAKGESYIPADVVKDMVNVVLAEQNVPFEEHDYVRECAYRWAGETAFEPQNVIAVESLLVMQLEGFEVRMKVDFAEMLEGGAAVHVVDFKSSRSMPTQESVARKRDDGTLFARSFQLVLYALGLAYGVPVRVEECPQCLGTKRRYDEVVPDDEPCDLCHGKGYVEVPEPFPLASRAQRFDLEYVYPGIRDKGSGLMARRSTTLTRAELAEYLESLRGLLIRVREAEETGDWPAVLSDEACGECPAASLCPIPTELRDHRGEINTVDQAREAMEVVERRSATDRALKAEIKAFCKSHGIDLRYGRDKVAEFVPTYAEEIKDKDALWTAVQRAREFGEPFERSDHVIEKRGTSFRARTLSADELAAEAAGEVDGDG